MNESISVTLPRDEQAVACFIGGGTVLIGRDNQTPHWDELTATQRAVTAARLRVLADYIEAPLLRLRDANPERERGQS